MRPIHVVLLLIVLALVAGAVTLAVQPDLITRMTESTKTIKDKKAIDEMAIGWVGAPYVGDYGALRVPGYLDNNSKQMVRVAKVRVQLLDEDGNKKEVVLHELQDVPAGQRKTFDLNAGTIRAARKAEISITELEVVR